jgi:hypothetical protein
MKTILIFLALVASAAHAQGIDEAEAPQSFTIHDGATGTALKGTDGKALSYPDYLACKVASRALFAATPASTVELKYRCVQASVLTFRRNCDGIPKPAPETFTIIDPNGVKYAGPFRKVCTDAEKAAGCVDEPATSWPEESWVRVLPDGTEYTFTGIAGLRVSESPGGEWLTEIEVLTNPDNYPNCWAWEWQAQAAPPVTEMSEKARQTWLTSDVTPEVDACGMGGDGASGDPTWAAYIPPKVCPAVTP